jgi:hypothetical protein
MLQQPPQPRETTHLAELAKVELWRRGDIGPLLLHAGQQELLREIESLPSHVKEICLRISRRWGKSTLALVYAFQVCLRKPRAQVIVAAPNQKQAANITAPLVRDLVEQAPRVQGVELVRQLKSSLRWEFANGSQLILGGFDTAADSFRGIRADLVIVEEGGATQAENFIYTTRSVLMPVLLSTGGKMLHVYTPAPVPDHPLHTVVEPRAFVNGSLFERNIHSCPLYTAEQVREMCEAVGGPTSLDWEREFLVKDRRDDNKVCVPEFQEALQVKDCRPLPPYTKTWIAVDVGGVRDLSAFQAYAYDPNQDCVRVLAEYTLPANPTHAQLAAGIEAMRQACQPHKPAAIIVDAPGITRSELAQTYGEAITFPSKPKDGFHANLVGVREALARGRLVVDPSCKMLITTLRSAQFNSNRTDYLWSELIGHADHLACLIYGLRHKQTDVRVPAQRVPEEERMLKMLAEMDARAMEAELDPDAAWA